MNGVVDKLMAKPIATLRAYLTKINKFHVSSISFATLKQKLWHLFFICGDFFTYFLALLFFFELGILHQGPHVAFGTTMGSF